MCYGRIAALGGKFVFGDINKGRISASDLLLIKKGDHSISQSVGTIDVGHPYLKDASGKRTDVSLQGLIDKPWAPNYRSEERRVGKEGKAELLTHSRKKKKIRMLVP